MQLDGKIVLVGGGGPGSDIVVVRLNPDGSRDMTFDGDGAALLSIGALHDRANAGVLQADGKIVVAGTSANAQTVVRLQPGGSLDTTFSGDGIKLSLSTSATGTAPNGLALQTDGGLVTAGFVIAGANQDVVLARFQGGGPTTGAPAAGGPGTGGGAPARDRLRGTPRADVIAGLAGANRIDAVGGNDIVCGGPGADRILGRAGPARPLSGGPPPRRRELRARRRLTQPIG